MRESARICYLGETFFKEKGFPEPLPKTFLIWERFLFFCIDKIS